MVNLKMGELWLGETHISMHLNKIKSNPMAQINYEQEVKKVYPDAWAEHLPIYDRYVIRMTKERYLNPRLNGLSDCTKKSAWRSAYEKLVSQNKIVNQNKSDK